MGDVKGRFGNWRVCVREVMAENEKLRMMVYVLGGAATVMLDYTNVEKS